MLNAPTILRERDAMKSAISDSGVSLTQDRFLSLQVPAPALPRQAEIAGEIERTFATVSRTAGDIDVQLTRAARLRQSILKAAFEGKLVPQNPAARLRSRGTRAKPAR